MQDQWGWGIKSTVILATIKAVTPNRTCNHCILSYHALTGKQKKTVWLKNIFDEGKKN